LIIPWKNDLYIFPTFLEDIFGALNFVNKSLCPFFTASLGLTVPHEIENCCRSSIPESP
jgi:hypothetical protein